tara:strand:- start:640 stop:798 length:159 start_codon:yes stop_codon:yes gene_type:complete
VIGITTYSLGVIKISTYSIGMMMGLHILQLIKIKLNAVVHAVPYVVTDMPRD